MKIEAPFGAETVAALNAYQSCGVFHPFTCENRHPLADRVMRARRDGWYCPSCNFTQGWAHDFMASPRWLARLKEVES